MSTGEGFKPLHLAAQGGHVEVVKVLNPEPSTLNPGPSTLNSEPCNLHPLQHVSSSLLRSSLELSDTQVCEP